MRKLVALTLFAVACGGGSEAPTKTEPEPGKPATMPVAEAPTPAAPAEPAAGTATDSAGEGEKVYNQYCIACHQADGKGMNGTLAGDFTSGRLGEKTDEQLLESVRNGFTGTVGAMPAWKGVLTEEQMKAALDYIKATYHPKG